MGMLRSRLATIPGIRDLHLLPIFNNIFELTRTDCVHRAADGVVYTSDLPTCPFDKDIWLYNIFETPGVSDDGSRLSGLRPHLFEIIFKYYVWIINESHLSLNLWYVIFTNNYYYGNFESQIRACENWLCHTSSGNRRYEEGDRARRMAVRRPFSLSVGTGSTGT